MIFTKSQAKEVLQYMLRRLLQLTFAERENMQYFEFDESIKILPSTVRAAISLITIGPIILMYPFVQKHFIKGIMIGSLKG